MLNQGRRVHMGLHCKEIKIKDINTNVAATFYATKDSKIVSGIVFFYSCKH